MAYRRSLDHQARGRGRAGGQDAHSGAHHRCEPSFSPRFSLVALLAIIASIMLVGFIFSGNACSSDDVSSAGGGAAEGQSASELDVTDSQAPEEARTVKVTFAGDCTLGTDESFDYSTSFNATFESKGDPSWFLANVEPIFADDDLTIVNMEGTLTEATARQDKTFAFKGEPTTRRSSRPLALRRPPLPTTIRTITASRAMTTPLWRLRLKACSLSDTLRSRTRMSMGSRLP